MSKLPITIRTILIPCVAIALAGCTMKPKVQQVGPVMASFQYRTLTANLGSDVRVPSVVTAAAHALGDRGYSVASRRVTEDAGRVVGVAPGASLGSHYKGPLSGEIEISAILTASGTRVKVTAHPKGNEAVSRAILDDVLLRLGI